MTEHSTKKRRRTDDASALSKKKKKTSRDTAGPQPTSFKISSIVKPQFAPPVIATSPGLCLPDSLAFNSYSKARKPSKQRKNEPATPSEMLLHSSAHTTVDYTAREGKGADALLKHYIGVFDPKTGKMQVVEAKKMVIRGVVRAKQATEEEMVQKTATSTTTDLRNDLGQAFGTKKAKKAIAAITENAIAPRRNADGSEPAPQKLGAADLALMETIKESTTSVPTREALQAVVDAAKPIPKGNFDADEIQDVYVPEEIIGEEVLKAIPVRDWQEAIKNAEGVQVRSRFVAHRINRVGTDDNAVQRLRVLRYLLFLVIFWITTKQGRERGTREILKRDKLRQELSPAPEVVIENIRRKFSENGVMRKFHIDLLMTHCCAFALILDSFDLNTWDLKEDLKLEQKQLNQYLSEIGARTRISKSAERTDHMAKLALPLVFPKMRLQRRGR